MGCCASSESNTVYTIQTTPASENPPVNLHSKPPQPPAAAAANPATAPAPSSPPPVKTGGWTNPASPTPAASGSAATAPAPAEVSKAKQFDEPTKDDQLIEASRNPLESAESQVHRQNEESTAQTPNRPKALSLQSAEAADQSGAPASPNVHVPQSPVAPSSPSGAGRHRGSLVLSSKADHEILVTIPFFEDLDRKSLKVLRQAFVHKTFEDGDLVVGVSDPGSFFVIISGSVSLSMKPETSAGPSLALPHSDSDGSHFNSYGELELAVLHSGSYFGSESLVEHTIQAVNVRALERSVLMSISRDKFNEFVGQVPSLQTSILDTTSPSKTRVTLKSIPFFAHLDEFKLQQLATLFEFQRFKKGDQIVVEGDVGDRFYIIVQGSALVTVTLPDSSEPQILDRLNEKDFFGELALVAHVPRTASVIADSDNTLCLYLDTERFHQFAACAPEVFDVSFQAIQNQRTSKLLKGIHLFDVLCQDELQESHEMMEMAKTPKPGSKSRRTPKAKSGSATPSPKPPVVIGDRKYDEHRLGLLAQLFGYISFPDGEVIFREGDRADKLYILLKGEVECSVKVESGTVVLNKMKAGQYFGEIGLLSSTSLEAPALRSATVTAITPVTCLFLTAAKFQQFLVIAPELRAQMEFAMGPRIAAIIENVPFFRFVKENRPWSKLSLLGELCEFEKAEEGEVLYRQGEATSEANYKFFIIVSGECVLSREISIDKPAEMEATAAAALNEEKQPQSDSQPSSTDGSPAPPTASLRVLVNAESVSEGPTTVSSPSNQSVNGPVRKILSTVLRRGKYFGQEALLNAPSRLATVKALSLSVFLTLSLQNFKKFLSISPEIRDLILTRQQNNYMETLERELLNQNHAPLAIGPESPKRKKKSKSTFARSFTVAANPLKENPSASILSSPSAAGSTGLRTPTPMLSGASPSGSAASASGSQMAPIEAEAEKSPEEKANKESHKPAEPEGSAASEPTVESPKSSDPVATPAPADDSAAVAQPATAAPATAPATASDSDPFPAPVELARARSSSTKSVLPPDGKLPPIIRAVSALPLSNNIDKERLQQQEREERMEQQLQLLSAELRPSNKSGSL